MALYYPEFVQAERTAAKTDYDILFDAVKVGICTGDAGPMPECSVPFLERIAPDFVRAAKLQDKSDLDLLTDAANIGLCAPLTPELLQELGLINPEELAPGSAGVIESEFDPLAAAALATPIGQVAPGSHCTDFTFLIPDLSAQIEQLIPPEIKCLVGWDRLIIGVTQAVADILKAACECPPGGFFDSVAKLAQEKREAYGFTGTIFATILDGLLWAFRAVGCNAQIVENYAQAITGVGAGEQAPVIALGIILGAFDRWVFTLPETLKDVVRRAMNFSMPYRTPTGPEANALLAANFISQADWECMQKADGRRLDYQSKIVDYVRTRPSDLELLLLQRKLDTLSDRASQPNPPPGTPDPGTISILQQQVADNFLHNGWTNLDSFKLWQTAQQWVPSPTDAINWMLKDVADPQVVDTFALDAEFKQKYAGDVKDVFDWNGIDDNTALNIWKAHWRNMAPTTLYELHKRLRPGWTVLWTPAEITRMVQAICPKARPRPGFDPYANRPVPQGPPQIDLEQAGVPNAVAFLAAKGFPVPTYCDELGTLELQQAWLESLGTTGYHVYEGLGESDYAPFWRERLLAISYRVITRVDARRAYEIGKLTFERLVAVFQDQGNSPADADALAAFVRFNAIQLNARRPAANSWVNNRYDTDLLKTTLMRQGMREDMWPDVFLILSARRSVKVQQDCLKSIEKQFLIGLLTEDQAVQQIEALNVTGSDTYDIIKDWKCVKLTRSKAESAAQICLYFKVGLIDGPTAQQLIVNLGYTRVQARRILALCFIRKLPKTIDTSKLPQALGLIGSLPE